MRKNSSTSGCSALAAKNWRMSGVWASLRAAARGSIDSWRDTASGRAGCGRSMTAGPKRIAPFLSGPTCAALRIALQDATSPTATPMTVPHDAALQALAQDLGDRMRDARHRLVTAESCTGGWIAKAVTDVAGSSDWFDCGLAAYS